MNSAYTVELWVKPTEFPNNTSNSVPILRKGSNFGIILRGDGAIGNLKVVSNEPLKLARWTHVAVVYDGVSNVKTYFNGEEVSNNSSAQYTTNNAPLYIGKLANGEAFKGQLDEIRIWDIARSKAAINTDRTRRLLGNENGLRAYYVLDDIALIDVNNDDFQEGVRDFTGNTKGTVATGIDWVEGDNRAAPIDFTKIIQDVPIDVILSDERHLLISPKSNFPDYWLEGAGLTAFITDNKIKDRYGNPAKGKNWSFVINKNRVQWDRNNMLLYQSEGVTSDFTVGLVNEGAVDVTYQFEDLPDWLSVTDDPGNGELPYGFTYPISFKTKETLSPGMHSGDVKVTVIDPSGYRLGVEGFHVELYVNCPSPNYTFDENLYTDQISLTATLNIRGSLSQDDNDRVYAYINEELRGIGKVSHINGQYLVNMQIHSSSNDNQPLEFRVWDASECKEYLGVVENHTYSTNTNIGSLESPVTLTTGAILAKNLSLPGGYSWVSFNLKNSGETYLLNSQAITGFHTGDQIISQQGDMITYTEGSGWSGVLKKLDYRQHYLVNLTRAATIQYKGRIVDEDTDIPVGAGTTWVSYIPQDIRPVDSVMNSLRVSATNGDQVQGREGFAEYLNGKWVGTLTYLVPNQGYRVIAAQAGILNYSGVAGAASVPPTLAPTVEAPSFQVKQQALDQGWTVKEGDYPKMMYITGIIDDTTINGQQEHIIAAFAGDQCRGVAIPQMIEGELHYFMVAYGDETDEPLTFQLMDGSTHKQHQLSNTVDFAPGASVGSYQTPYQWHLGERAPEAEGYQLYQNYPNPFSETTTISYVLPEASKVSISIFDMAGRKVKTLVDGEQERGNHQVEWHRDNGYGGKVPAGIYIVSMQAEGALLQRKMIVKE